MFKKSYHNFFIAILNPSLPRFGIGMSNEYLYFSFKMSTRFIPMGSFIFFIKNIFLKYKTHIFIFSSITKTM